MNMWRSTRDSAEGAAEGAAGVVGRGDRVGVGEKTEACER